MTLSELISNVLLKATGKAKVIDQTNNKWEKIRGIANYYINAWQNEPAVGNGRWNSLYNRAYRMGTANVGSEEIDIDEEIKEISASNGDCIYIESTDGKKYPFELVEYNDLKNYPQGRYCARIGNTLVFNKKFEETDPYIGGSIFAPVYLGLEDLEDPDDDVLVDNPYWLVTICAAEYIRNDIVKQNQYGNLIAEANNLMNNMIRANRAAQDRHVRGNWRNVGGM